jgi:hypothetical protein
MARLNPHRGAWVPENSPPTAVSRSTDHPLLPRSIRACSSEAAGASVAATTKTTTPEMLPMVVVALQAPPFPIDQPVMSEERQITTEQELAGESPVKPRRRTLESRR